MKIGDVSLVQNSTKHPQFASELSGENSCEISSLKVWNKPSLAPVPFGAFFGFMVMFVNYLWAQIVYVFQKKSQDQYYVTSKSHNLAAGKTGDSPIRSDVKLGLQTHLGAESQSEGTLQLKWW